MHPCSHAPMRFFPDTPVRLISPSPFHRFTACPELSRRVSFRRNDLPPRVSVSPCLRVKRFFSSSPPRLLDPSPMLPLSHAPTRFFSVSPCLRVKRFFSPSPMLPCAPSPPRPLSHSLFPRFPVSPFPRFVERELNADLLQFPLNKLFPPAISGRIRRARVRHLSHFHIRTGE